MVGAGLQLARGCRDNRSTSPATSRGVHQSQRTDQLRGARGGVAASQSPVPLNEKPEVLADSQPEKPAAGSEELLALKPVAVPPSCNLERFLESVKPSVPTQYFSKTTMRGWRTCDMEFQPYFVLGDLWESFREWSAYGAGVPLILDDSESVIQYYVPYLSGIQIYGKSMKSCANPSQRSEDSDSDFRDSSSDGSSDCERLTNDSPPRMERLSLRDQLVALQEDGSSDEGESLKSRGYLLFEYLERDPPYSREPLSEKLLDLASRFPEMKTLKSCDIMASSWISVAWYPIYRIPTGPMLKDLDACFLTYHSLHTPLGGAQTSRSPVVAYPNVMEGAPKMSLPVFGVASYKFRGPFWNPTGDCEDQLSDSLLRVADIWLRRLQVNHPDFMFFCRR